MLPANITFKIKRAIIAVIIALIILLIPAGAYAASDIEIEALPELIITDSSQDTRKSSNDETSTDFKTDSSGQSGSTNFFEEPQLIKPDDSFSPADIETTISQGQDKPVNVTTTETPPLITEPPDTDNTSEHNIFNNSADTIENDRDTANTSDVADCEDISSEPADDSVMVETTDEVLAVNIEDTETAPVGPVGGNSYKAEITVNDDGTTAGMNQDVELTITYTELSAGTSLGSAQLEVDETFTVVDQSGSVTASNSFTCSITAEDSSFNSNCYIATITPNNYVQINNPTVFTITFEETGIVNLGSAQITIPDAYFEAISFDPLDPASITVDAAGGKTWSGALDTVNYVLSLWADNPGSYLVSGESVSAVFSATPTAVGEHTFTTEAWQDAAGDDGSGNFTGVGVIENLMAAGYSDPEVSVTVMSNILTGVELTLNETDGVGNYLPLPEPMPHPDVELLDLRIEYTFELPDGHQYLSGDYFEFFLPDVFAVFNAVGPEPLLNPANVPFGTYTLNTEGLVRLEFNNQIEGVRTIGFVAFQTELVESNLGNDLEQQIEIDIRDAQKVIIYLSFEPNVTSSIDKRGSPNPRSYNAESISWEVDFNKDHSVITDPVLKDPIGTNQELIPGTVKLYNLVVKLDGTVEQGTEVDAGSYIVEATDGGGAFQLRFIAAINSAYRLVFETTITDDVSTSYSNVATLTGAGITDIPASATVTVGRGNPLAKSSTGYTATTQTISWEVRANYNEKTLSESDSAIRDTMGSNQELVSGSIVVRMVEIGPDGSEIGSTILNDGSDYILTEGHDGVLERNYFEISFPGGISNAHRVNFQTRAVDRVYENTTITNTVTFNGLTRTANRSITQMILAKTHDQVDYTAKTVRWTISVNMDSHVMTTLVLNDIFTNQGLTVLPATFTISGTGITPADYTYSIEDHGFVITFNRAISVPLTIHYRTEFDYETRLNPALNYFENRAELDWLDNANNPRSRNAISRFTPDSYTQANGFKNGDYNAITKEITWEVGVNYNLQPVTEAQVFDYILGDQTLVPGSIRVYEATPGGSNPNQLIRGNEIFPNIEIGITDGIGNPGFRVDLGNITSPYIIDYTTSIADRLVVGQYSNTAYLRDAVIVHAVLNATLSVPYGGTYTDKSAIQSGRIIGWQIIINAGQSALANVAVTDHLSPWQIFLEDSLFLYPTLVNAQGNLTKDAPPLQNGVDYTLTVTRGTYPTEVNGTGDSFVLAFTSNIDRAYILEYESFVLVGDNEVVSNNAVLTASTPGMPADTGSSEAVRVRITAGQGGISGELGNLSLRKVSANDGSPLQGAVFDIYHESGNFRIATGITNENGILTFNNLVYGNYHLVETTAPVGYVMRTDTTVAIINANENDAGDILNDLIIRDVRLLKTDSVDGRFVAGAEFELLRTDDGAVIGRFVTDASGEIYVADLEAGNYRFVEVQPANNYRLDQTPVNFIVAAEQIAVTEVTKENDFISFVLTKVDDYDPSILLEGARFRFEDDSGNIIAAELITDLNGHIIITALRPGTYRLIETLAPVHYQLDSTPIPFDIASRPSETLEITALNALITGFMELTKVDSRNGNPLPGAVFRLVYQDGTVVFDNLVTDANGQIMASDLRPGTYRLIELSPPAGYRIMSRTTLLDVGLSALDGTGDLQELAVANARIIFSQLQWFDTFFVLPEDNRFFIAPASLLSDPGSDDEQEDNSLVDEQEQIAGQGQALPSTDGDKMRVVLYAALLCIISGLLILKLNRQRQIDY